MATLRRLAAKGIVRKAADTHTYVLTPLGIRFAVFYSATYQRILKPLLAIDAPDAPRRSHPEVRAALRTLDKTVDDYVRGAGITA